MDPILALIGILIILFAIFGTILPALPAFIPQMGVSLLRYVTRNRIIIFAIAFISTISLLMISNIIFPLYGVIIAILLSFLLRPWFVFKQITDPQKVSADRAALADDEMIIGLPGNELNQPVAYPLHQMVIPRHIVNDTINGEHILVSFCAACNSGIIYKGIDPTSGERLIFNVLTVYRRNLIMRDNQTKTIWQQSVGEGIFGELKGEDLEFIGGIQMTWKGWKEEYPDTRVAIEPEKSIFLRLHFKVLMKLLGITNTIKTPGKTNLESSIDPHDDIIGITIDGVPKAYPLNILKEKLQIEDTHNGVNLRLLFNEENQSVNVYQIENGDESGSIPYEKHWWLGWKEFRPNTKIYSD